MYDGCCLARMDEKLCLHEVLRVAHSKSHTYWTQSNPALLFSNLCLHLFLRLPLQSLQLVILDPTIREDPSRFSLWRRDIHEPTIFLGGINSTTQRTTITSDGFGEKTIASLIAARDDASLAGFDHLVLPWVQPLVPFEPGLLLEEAPELTIGVAEIGWGWAEHPRATAADPSEAYRGRVHMWEGMGFVYLDWAGLV